MVQAVIARAWDSRTIVASAGVAIALGSTLGCSSAAPGYRPPIELHGSTAVAASGGASATSGTSSEAQTGQGDDGGPPSQPEWACGRLRACCAALDPADVPSDCDVAYVGAQTPEDCANALQYFPSWCGM